MWGSRTIEISVIKKINDNGVYSIKIFLNVISFFNYFVKHVFPFYYTM